jgi:hypothetical protein
MSERRDRMMANSESKRKSAQRVSQSTPGSFLCVPSRMPLRSLRSKFFIMRGLVVVIAFAAAATVTAAQTRRRKTVAKPATQQQALRASAAKFSSFLHSSEKHKSLACNACHKVPTAWTAKRDFPDVADFPDHDACVRCHRRQFFTRQSFVSAGPAICTVCHVRAAPREDGRFVFGKPNVAGQTTKPKDERQFTIEFPHDKHQNVIASVRPGRAPNKAAAFIRASFFGPLRNDEQKPDYNNCSICHSTKNTMVDTPAPRSPDVFEPTVGTFKTMPHSHDSCFNCHWKNQKPAGAECSGCHKHADAFVATDLPVRKSAKFSHEGGQGEHVIECTTCHINITRASTLRGLTPDVPIVSCATCHNNNKTITYKNIVTIETELAQFKKTGECHYCHTPEVGKKQPPASHEAAVK